MTPEQQRIALEEWRGGMLHNGNTQKLADGTWHRLTAKGWELIPDFPNDLNAVAKLEERLTWAEANEYLLVLTSLDERFKQSSEVGTRIHTRVNYALVISATAPQRCEALLKTLGLWKSE